MLNCPDSNFNPFAAYNRAMHDVRASMIERGLSPKALAELEERLTSPEIRDAVFQTFTMPGQCGIGETRDASLVFTLAHAMLSYAVGKAEDAASVETSD